MKFVTYTLYYVRNTNYSLKIDDVLKEERLLFNIIAGFLIV